MAGIGQYLVNFFFGGRRQDQEAPGHGTQAAVNGSDSSTLNGMSSFGIAHTNHSMSHQDYVQHGDLNRSDLYDGTVNSKSKPAFCGCFTETELCGRCERLANQRYREENQNQRNLLRGRDELLRDAYERIRNLEEQLKNARGENDRGIDAVEGKRNVVRDHLRGNPMAAQKRMYEAVVREQASTIEAQRVKIQDLEAKLDEKHGIDYITDKIEGQAKINKELELQIATHVQARREDSQYIDALHGALSTYQGQQQDMTQAHNCTIQSLEGRISDLENRISQSRASAEMEQAMNDLCAEKDLQMTTMKQQCQTMLEGAESEIKRLRDSEQQLLDLLQGNTWSFEAAPDLTSNASFKYGSQLERPDDVMTDDSGYDSGYESISDEEVDSVL